MLFESVLGQIDDRKPGFERTFSKQVCNEVLERYCQMLRLGCPNTTFDNISKKNTTERKLIVAQKI